MKLLAKTLFGLENVLAEELRNLGSGDVEVLNRAVSFDGDLECLYKVNLWSRTALRVLKPIIEFSAHNETVLYKRTRRFDWTKLFGLDQTFAIDSTVHSELFPHSKYVALKIKDAIVDLFRYKNNGRRPSIDVKNPDYRINVHCRENEFTISLDSSGESLHRRGYRQGNQQAPLNEVLAAGMIMLSGWNGDKPLFDPMCGSGTILIEAIMIAQNVPPRMNRDHYSFMNWEDYDAQLWNGLRVQALEGKRKVATEMIGHDIDGKQVRLGLKDFRTLGYLKVQMRQSDFLNSEAPCAAGVIIMNPPYGERMASVSELRPEAINNLEEFYSQIGDTLKKKYSGWDAWIISANRNALKRIGLRPSKKYTLYNGSLECRFQKFEMYRGSKPSYVKTSEGEKIKDRGRKK